MGIGNLQGVLRAYGEDAPSYARVYFDSTPTRHAAVQRRLAAFGDDSSTYLWKIYAARDIMRLYRRGPGRARAARGAADGQELRRGGAAPARATRRASPTPGGAQGGVGRRRRSARFPNDPARHRPRARPDAWASWPGACGVPRGLYRGLRPEALAHGALHRRADARVRGRRRRRWSSPRPCATRPTSACSCASNREATRNFSLHTTGWAFDIARSLPLAAPGAGVPVRARPAAGARRDRLGARARARSTSPRRATRRRCCRCSIAGSTLEPPSGRGLRARLGLGRRLSAMTASAAGALAAARAS